ncbi:unnamed protein product [Phytophthora fragariaefolia]|uniref:Unnamed protein product n=1 Tax=Phytophthora fragariaefolia TaxID=1490495 RepID=A0A9W6UA57_9STRA|nr:unnamed protein product [Phytophthora fragariaefolia]
MKFSQRSSALQLVQNPSVYHSITSNIVLLRSEWIPLPKVDVPRVVVPIDLKLRQTIIQCHDTNYGGHPGAEWTYLTLARRWYWSKILKSIQRFIADFKLSISMDFITDLPRTKHDVDSILVVVDRLTKRCQFVPTTKTVTSERFARLLIDNIWKRHGMPSSIVSVRGRKFVSSFWQYVFKSIGTKLNMTVTHRAQGDGQMERMNRTLEEDLRCFVGPLQDDWDIHLANAECAFNLTVNFSTKLAPFEAEVGYILMHESDIPLTAASTPSGMLWEWLVVPQGLKNAPATFNRRVTHLLRSVRDFAPSYFDDVFIHNRAVNGKSDVEMHKEHLRKLLAVMRKHKHYANLKKCIFGASEIPVLGCLVGTNGVRPDPGKVRVINEWPTPSNVKELRQFRGLATYLCKYVSNYAGKIRPLSQLLKKDAAWDWTAECQQAHDAVRQGLTEAPILAVTDQDRPFHVMCDASDFAIGCALMQHDHEDRVVYYQSRQLKPGERNYPVHDKERFAMKYALAKFRENLLGSRQSVIYTHYASLRTAIKSPHISQRMARWISFFAEYNFPVEYNPGRSNVVADALSRRPDYAVHKADANVIGVVRTSTPSSSLLDDVRFTYANDADAKQLLDYFAAPSDKSSQKLAKHLRARLRITYEYHDTPTSGHPGREKTYLLLTRDFYWSHQYKWVRKYVRTCEACQRLKPAPFPQAPLQSLPTPSECWQSISMDFISGLPPDNKRRTGIVVFVDRFSKMVHLAAVRAEVTAKQTARLFVDMVFRHHGMPIDIVSDRDPRFTSRFWQEVFTLLGTQLSISTADHPQTDGQTERVNRVLVDALKSYAHTFHHWSDCLPMAEFAINNPVHVSTGYTPFYVNAMRHLRVPSVIGAVAPSLSWGGYPVSSKPNKHGDMSNTSAVSTRARTARSPIKESTVSTQGVETLNTNEQYMQAGPVVNKDVELNNGFSSKTMDFVQRRQPVIQFVQGAIATSVDRQKLNADNNGRRSTNEFKVGSLVMLAIQNLAKHAVSDFGASKLAPRFIGPFTVLAKHGNAYTLDIPSSMRLHPTFYVGQLKPYS